MLKKCFALLLVCCLFCPLLASADTVTKADFDLKLEVYPENFPREEEQTAQALKDGLEMLGFSGVCDYNSNGYFVLNGQMTTNGKNPVTLGARSSNRFIEVSSSLLGEERLCLYMDAYLEFMMKPYNFLGLQTQYLALATCLYATHEPWGFFMAIVNQYCGGEGTRHIETQALQAMAAELYDLVDNNRDMRYWLMAALMDIGLDSTVNDFFYSLPEWIEQCAGDEGLTIQVEGDTSNWILGSSTIATVTHSAQTDSLIITLSDWEGYAFKFANIITAQDQTLTLLLDSEEEGTILDIKLKALGLPNKQKHSGVTKLSASIGGEYVANPIDEKATLDWEWDSTGEPEALKATLSWLNKQGQPQIALDGFLTLSQGDAQLFNYTDWDLQSGTHLFSIYEETLKELIDKVKGPLVETLIPIYLDLPVSFLETITDWLAQSGIAAAIISGM